MPSRASMLAFALSTLVVVSLAHAQSAEDHHGERADQHQHGEHGDLHSPGYHRDFSDADRWSKIFDAPERVEWQKPDHVIELMEIESGMSVVDLGSGTGFFLGPLSAAVGDTGRVRGLDVAQELVDHANERAKREGWSNVSAHVVPFDDPQLEAGSIDRVLIVNTWHHMDDRPRYSAKLGEALTDGGRIYVVDFTEESELGPPKDHRLPAERVVAELEAAGLQAEIIEEDLPRQYVVMAHAAR